MNKIPGLVFVVLLASCATTYQPRHYVNEILIVNNSRSLVQDVTISVGETGRKFSCGNVAPLGICSNKFPRRPYQRKPIRVGWAFGSRAGQTGDFVLSVPATFHLSFPLRGVVEIAEDGTVRTYFEQDTPAF